MEQEQISALFDQCDSGGRGWLTLGDLKTVCPELTEEELKFIFKAIDTNNNGRIEKEEFLKCFVTAVAESEKRGFSGVMRRASLHPTSPTSSTPPVKMEIPVLKTQETIFDSEFEKEQKEVQIPCQEDVLALYEQLQSAGVPQLLNQFEKVVGTFCHEIKSQKEQNEHLQKTYFNEREWYQKQLAEVESDLEQQLVLADQKAREQERERLVKEKEEMRKKLESEMAELKGNIGRLQRMDNMLQKESEKGDKVLKMNMKIQDMSVENRDLKNNLADNQLEMALIKAELAQMRAEYEAKTTELMSDREILYASINDQDNMTRQLQLLYDANKKLHDTNDSLRHALEQRSLLCKQFNLCRFPAACAQSISISALDTERSESPGSVDYSRKGSEASVASGNRFLRPMQLNIKSSVETDDDIDSGLASHGTRNGAGSEYSSESDTYESQRTIVLDLTPSIEPTGTPERTFRVVMAGDAAVGKSSLIMRLVKNEFIGNLPSTLGVDFHVKVLRVRDRNVAVQLWDTAGQERFRSLCSTYFRRADGAILMYDCTCEESFINVRNWIEMIQGSATKKIPVLLCGNKVDLRVARAAEGKRVIAAEDGERLAKLHDAAFVETSAKDGFNSSKALHDLTLQLLDLEDMDVMGSVVLGNAGTSGKGASCYSKPSCSKS